MNLRAVIIDEAVHIEDPRVTRLWQKTLWVKEKGYRQNYTSSVLPLGTDDFFATHLIIVDELPNGSWEPVVMYKSVRKSQADRFKIPFGGLSLLSTTPYQSSPIILNILNSAGDISYDSSWTINPDYKKDKDFSKLLRDFVTMFCCFHHLEAGYSRWLTAGVKQFKIDNYFEWLGGQQLFPEFPLEIIDNQLVRMFYVPDTRTVPHEALAVANSMKSYWDNRIVFEPKKSNLIKHATYSDQAA